VEDDTQVKQMFAERIKSLREKKNRTQREVAEELHVSVSTVSDWELAKKLPRAGAIEKLSRYFGVTKSSLFENQIIISKRNDLLDIIENNSDLTYDGKPVTQEQLEKIKTLLRVIVN
jgi:transcriptional regulator with XRE-family HTH domain